MTLFLATYTGNQTNTEIVEGVAGKRLLVRRVQASLETAGYVKLLSDPGGGSQADLTPPLYVGAYGSVDLVAGRDGGLATPSGKGVGVTSSLGGPGRGHGLMVWYEVVDG